MSHGEAVNQFCKTESEDSKRPLTENGQSEAFKMGQWLAKNSISLNEIYVSPYRRTQQTCQRLLVAMEESKIAIKTTLKPITLDFITPLGDVKEVNNFIDKFIFSYGNNDKNMNKRNLDSLSILIISHMPLVSDLLSQLTASENRLFFATGTMVKIDYDVESMQGDFVSIISPSQ